MDAERDRDRIAELTLSPGDGLENRKLLRVAIRPEQAAAGEGVTPHDLDDGKVRSMSMLADANLMRMKRVRERLLSLLELGNRVEGPHFQALAQLGRRAAEDLRPNARPRLRCIP